MKTESADVTKRIQALATAMKAQHEGKATAEHLKLVGEAAVNRPGDISKARKAAGISGERGSKSAVEITVNGKNGKSVGWEEFYALKSLADKAAGTVTLTITPSGNPSAKPVSGEKIERLFEALDARQGKENAPTPSQVAEQVAK